MTIEGKYISEYDVDNWADDTTQTEMQEIIDRIEETIEDITEDIFYVKTFHEFLDGNGKDQIFPLFPYKILSVNKIAVSDIDIDTLDFTSTNISGSSGESTVTLTQSGISANYYQNDYIGIYDNSATEHYWGSRIVSHTATSSGDVIYTLADALPMTLEAVDTASVIYNWDWNSISIYRNPILTHHEPGDLMEPYEFFTNDIFAKGKRNIEVWGSYGKRICPKQIKQAAIILARYENDDTLYSSYGVGMKSEKLGDYTYSRFSDLQKNENKLTGISEADKLLSRYINRRPKLGVS